MKFENNVYSTVANIAQNSHDVTQTANLNAQPEDLAKMVRELSAHLDELQLDQGLDLN